LMTLMRAVEMRTCAKRVKKIKKGEEVELINTHKRSFDGKIPGRPKPSTKIALIYVLKKSGERDEDYLS